METLSRRLTPDTYEELREMISLFERGEMPDYPAGMERHFAVAKKKPEDFKNHAAVLGISIGGSSTKVMLGAMKDGFLEVKHLRAMENPTEATAFDDFLDKLIANDPAVDQYLRAEEPACIGVSLPMTIIDVRIELSHFWTWWNRTGQCCESAGPEWPTETSAATCPLR